MRTPNEVREHFRLAGQTVAQWARDNGYSPMEVYRVLDGVTKGHYGRSHEIYVKLGMKPVTEDLGRAQSTEFRTQEKRTA